MNRERSLRMFALAVIIFISFSNQIVSAAYNSTYLTPAEVRRLNQETIAREQAIRVRKKKLLMAQERKRQMKRAQLQKSQLRGGKKYRHHFQQPRSAPAWRRSAGHIVTHSDNEALLNAAKSRNLTLLKRLIDEGANVNYKNFDGESALHIAASVGHIRMVQYLLDNRANVNARTRKNWLPIHHAIRFNHPIVANYLIANKALLWSKNTDGFSAIDFAKKSSNPHLKAIARKNGRY